MFLKNICKSFGETEVLKDFNLEIDEEIVKERWENMNQNFKEKLGKRGE